MKKNHLASCLATLAICISSTVCCSQSNFKAAQFQLGFDNDCLNYRAKGTDHYYSAGLSLVLYYSKRSSNSLFDKVLLTLPGKTSIVYNVGLTQQMFTPSAIRTNDVAKMDYPYAGVLRFHHAAASVNMTKKQRLTSQFHIGVIGKYSFAEQSQSLVHRLIGDPLPNGWDQQVSTKPDIGYSIKYEDGLLQPVKGVELIGYAEANVGTINDHASVGVNCWISPGASYFHETGSITKGRSQKNHHRFNIALQVQPSIRWVAYNGILQSGGFNAQYYQAGSQRSIAGQQKLGLSKGQLNRCISELQFGIAIRAWTTTIALTQRIQSAEFKGIPHQEYGNITLRWKI